MAFLQDKRSRTLVLIMSVLVVLAIIFSRYYYRSVNDSYDPRVVPAKKLYSKYNTLAQINDFEGVFILLDSIEGIYESYPYYKNSYETGVLYNNRAAAYLIMAMHKDSLVINSKYLNKFSVDTLLVMAQESVNESIRIYTNWLAVYEDETEVELEAVLKGEFMDGLEGYSDKETAKFTKRRLVELKDAQIENKRRLSVSYTNLGIIFRNLGQYELALENYQKAIDLWEENLSAQNNLNILLDRPLEKRNIIQRLFPPQK